MAFKLTKEALEELIASSTYHRLTTRTMICILTLKSGFEVVGKAAVLNTENFVEEVGKKVAYDDAVDQLWQLEGYAHLAAHATVILDNGSISFPDALKICFNGFRICRAGWNGKGMWVAVAGRVDCKTRVEAQDFWSAHAREFARSNGGVALVSPALLLKAADNTITMGWIPSSADLMADDWMVLPS